MCFRAYVTNWLLCQTHGIDPTVQPHWLYIWEHRWIVVLLLISVDWFKYSNSSASCYKCILNWFGCIVWRPKAIYLQKGTLNDRLRNKSNPYIFHTFISFEFSIYRVFIVPNLNCIHAIFTMLWPFQSMLGPRCSTGWSVAKLILGSVEYAHGFVALCLNIISFFLLDSSEPFIKILQGCFVGTGTNEAVWKSCMKSTGTIPQQKATNR